MEKRQIYEPHIDLEKAILSWNPLIQYRVRDMHMLKWPLKV